MKPVRVLCVSEYFLPGFRGGGPVRTLRNIPSLVGKAVEFSYLTRDRDLGCSEAYGGVTPDDWADYPYGKVFHATELRFGPGAVSRALTTSDTDIIYLNCFFGLKSSIAIVARHWARSYGKPVLLAPRGEFSPGALALKRAKKKLFLALARALGLYRKLWWHASTEEERQDILRQFPEANARIFVAEDPVEMANPVEVSDAEKTQGAMRLVFVSRITRKKNLDGLLNILNGAASRVTLRIYGPIEDEAHWQQCLSMIDNLPPNVTAEYLGDLYPDEVSRAFGEGDLFAFPTHGENFGHVIFEALGAGTPVLVSDQTPWQPDDTHAVTRLSLEDVDAWRAQIDLVAQLTKTEQQERRADALRYAKRHAASDKTRQDNLHMFQEVVRRSDMRVR